MNLKVVSLNALPNGRSPGQRLLGECRDLLLDRLSLWLRALAPTIGEELFVLADSTRDRLLQTRYLDLRADIESSWTQYVEHFRRTFGQVAGADAGRNGNDAQAFSDASGLSLMDDAVLSEHIVLREFSAQLSESCDEELYTLNRRVALLLDRETPCDEDNPLAPGIVCTALSNACVAIGDDAVNRLILLRRIERHLHAGLPPIYQQVNAMLIERGILPDLIRTYRRSSSFTTDTPAAPAGAASAAAATAARDDGSILAALQRLAELRTLPGASAGGPAQPLAGLPAALTAFAGTAQPGHAAPIDAASIDTLLRSALAGLPQPITAPAGPALTLDGEMQALVNQVRVVRDSPGAQELGGLEAVTLDIVAMLFDFIFDDAHVPLAIKALLSRLQIPVLKVAMLNPGFFADRQHPTRRFLGGIAGVAIRWGDEVDENDPFYAKLAELVDRIQANFEDKVEVFGEALAELEAFVDAHDAEEDDTTLAAANHVLQREQESAAWERAQSALRDFLALRALPAALHAFLNEHWLGVLQQAALAAATAAPDDDSGQRLWDSTQSLMGDLAWSVEAKRGPDDRLRLVSLLPELLSGLNRGLDRTGTTHEARGGFFDALVKLHAAALRGEAAPTTDAPPPPATPTTDWSSSNGGELLVTRSLDHGVEVEDVILVGAPPVWRADEREIQREVGALKRGDWVEFRDDQGHSTRERLNWISPQRGILLFSNHQAAKAISIAPEALVRQIRDGKAAIVHPEAIFERALSGALDSLTANPAP